MGWLGSSPAQLRRFQQASVYMYTLPVSETETEDVRWKKVERLVLWCSVSFLQCVNVSGDEGGYRGRVGPYKHCGQLNVKLAIYCEC